MKKISERLSSLNTATWTIVVLILWFFGGMFLASSKVYSKGFNLMNATLVREWLNTNNECTLLKGWFVGLCLVMAFLGLNLVVCSWTKMLKILRGRFTNSRFLLLIVHIFFGLVALGHFGSFMLGFRYDNLRLLEGQTVKLREGLEVSVRKINFIDDPRILTKGMRKIDPQKFHYKSNRAEVVLRREGWAVIQKDIGILNPFTFQGTQVSLKEFTPPPEQANNGVNQQKPGVVLVVSNYPFKDVFMAVYLLMIIGIAIHLAMTWRSPSNTSVSPDDQNEALNVDHDDKKG